jgi:hypothetical protein
MVLEVVGQRLRVLLVHAEEGFSPMKVLRQELIKCATVASPDRGRRVMCSTLA